MGDKKIFTLLEVGFSLGVMSLVDTGIMNISDFVSMLTLNVARFYGLEAGFIKEDKVANLVLFNPDKKWNYNYEFIYKNELYNKALKGKVVLNIVSGLVEYANI